MILVICTMLGHGRFLHPLYSLSTSVVPFQPLCICTPSIDSFLSIVSTIVHMYEIEHHMWHTNIMSPTSISDPFAVNCHITYLCTSIARKVPINSFHFHDGWSPTYKLGKSTKIPLEVCLFTWTPLEVKYRSPIYQNTLIPKLIYHNATVYLFWPIYTTFIFQNTS